jgi:hypothetical protein
MTRLVVLLGSLAALALGRDLAAQQQRQARDGFWFGAALGGGWAGVSCQICKGGYRRGLSGALRLGGGVSRAVLIGAEVAAWRTTIDTNAKTVHQSLAAFGAAAYWYPSRRRPLYLKLGIGLVTHRADDGTDVITSTAIGPLLGVGYEWPVSARLLVSPFINVALGIAGGSLKFNGGKIESSPGVSLAQLGLGITWHQVPLLRTRR